MLCILDVEGRYALLFLFSNRCLFINIFSIRKNMDDGLPLLDAIQSAMQHCIRRDIMRKYLQNHE